MLKGGMGGIYKGLNLLSQHLSPRRYRPRCLKKLLDRWFCFLPEGVCIRNNHLHALALELEKVRALTGLHLRRWPSRRPP